MNSTPFNKQPKYIVHDNDPVFKEKQFQRFLSCINIKSKGITSRGPWQNGICERLVGIVRRELLDHIILFNQRHLERLLAEYVHYYNNTRTHQALNRETPIRSKPPPATTAENTLLYSEPILGGLYYNYQKAA
jgi:transposase InsO family protein